jgi:ribonuclease G
MSCADAAQRSLWDFKKTVEDNREWARLRDVLNKMSIPDGMGVMIHTAGIGTKMRYFVPDLHILLKNGKTFLSSTKVVESRRC